MLPVGHIAYTWAALAWLQSKGRAGRVDYRVAAVVALLPDLIDKPLSLTLLSHSGTSQSIAHTALAHALGTAAVARARPAWLTYALIANAHLAADQMWKYRRTLFFPFSGGLDSWQFMGTPAAMLSAYAEIVTRPAILAVEAVGLGLLAWVVRRGKLGQKPALGRLLRSGQLDLSPAGAGRRQQREGSCA
jgi:hypothetical protein